MAADRYTIHAVTINGTTFSGIKSYTMNANMTSSFEVHDGQAYPTFGAVLDQAPDLVIRTVDIAGLVAAVGMTPLAITSITVFWQKRADCGTRASGNVHLKATATTGCAVLRPISPQDNQIVEAEIHIYVTSSDGLTDPWTWTDNQALSGTIQPVAHYTLGPVTVTPSAESAVAVPCKSWTFDPGIQGETDTTDGLPFHNYYDVESISPTLEVMTPDASVVMALTMKPKVAAAVFYLRKMQESGIGRVANATAEHIKFTIADCIVNTSAINGSVGQKADTTVTFGVTYDGSNSPVVINFASAIT